MNSTLRWVLVGAARVLLVLGAFHVTLHVGRTLEFVAVLLLFAIAVK